MVEWELLNAILIFFATVAAHTCSTHAPIFSTFFSQKILNEFDFTIAFDLVNVILLLLPHPFPWPSSRNKYIFHQLFIRILPYKTKKTKNRQNITSPFCRWHNPFYTFLNRCTMYTMCTASYKDWNDCDWVLATQNSICHVHQMPKIYKIICKHDLMRVKIAFHLHNLALKIWILFVVFLEMTLSWSIDSRIGFEEAFQTFFRARKSPKKKKKKETKRKTERVNGRGCRRWNTTHKNRKTSGQT